MENVPATPEPVIDGYGVKSFLIDNSRLLGEGFMGLEQRRIRRFSFGLKNHENNQVPSLMRWVDLAVFLLPDAQRTCVTSTDGGVRPSERQVTLPRSATGSRQISQNGNARTPWLPQAA